MMLPNAERAMIGAALPNTSGLAEATTAIR